MNPFVSIITPVENRIEELTYMLKSTQVARNKYGENCEHIVVDSSVLSVSRIVEKLCYEYGAIYLHTKNKNVRHKRNIGVKKSIGELLLFLDSDIEATPELIFNHINYLSEKAPGTIGVVEFKGKATIWNKIIEASSHVEMFSYALNNSEASWAPTANLLLRKSCFEYVGGFKVNMPNNLGGDDLDLTMRITNKYGNLKCAPNALCYHQRKTWGSISSVINRTFRWGKMEFYLMNFHPQKKIFAPAKFSIFSFLVFSFLIALFHNPISAFIFWLVWIFFSLFLFQFLQGFKGFKELSTPITTFGSAFIELLFELGCVYESTKKRSVVGFFYSFLSNPKSINKFQYFSTINIQANIFSLIIVYILAMFFLQI